MPGRYGFEIVVYFRVLERIDGTERSKPNEVIHSTQPEQF
jgi:hypothetical protein